MTRRGSGTRRTNRGNTNRKVKRNTNRKVKRNTLKRKVKRNTNRKVKRNTRRKVSNRRNNMKRRRMRGGTFTDGIRDHLIQLNFSDDQIKALDESGALNELQGMADTEVISMLTAESLFEFVGHPKVPAGATLKRGDSKVPAGAEMVQTMSLNTKMLLGKGEEIIKETMASLLYKVKFNSHPKFKAIPQGYRSGAIIQGSPMEYHGYHQEMNKVKGESIGINGGMEDFMSFYGSPEYDFMGIFDGHGGCMVAAWCAIYAPYFFLPMNKRTDLTSPPLTSQVLQGTQLTLSEEEKDMLQTSVVNTFLSASQEITEEVPVMNIDTDNIQLEMDKQFSALDNFVRDNGDFVNTIPSDPTQGTTATIVVIDKRSAENKMYVANVGDSRALLCKASSVEPLTVDHDCGNQDELIRLDRYLAENSELFKEIYGDDLPDHLYVDRGRAGVRFLGDHEITRSIGNYEFQRQGMSTIPNVMDVPITSDDKVLVVASDGLKKKLDDGQVYGIVKFLLERGHSEQKVAEVLVACCKDPKGDNICVSVKKLNEFDDTTREDDVVLFLKNIDEAKAMKIFFNDKGKPMGQDFPTVKRVNNQSTEDLGVLPGCKLHNLNISEGNKRITHDATESGFNMSNYGGILKNPESYPILLTFTDLTMVAA